MTIEVALAVGLFSALLAVLHSIQVERSELLAASASTNFRMVISVEADAPSGLPISPEQLGRVQETFGDKATHWGPTASQVRLSDGTPAFFGRGERIHVRYSSAVPAGSFYASGRAEELLLSDDYTSTGLPTETLEELRSRIAAGHLHKMTSPAPQPLDEPLDELIERHLEPLRMLERGYSHLDQKTITEEDIILLPLSESDSIGGSASYLLAFFFATPEYPGSEVIEAVSFVQTLLKDKYGEQFYYSYHSGLGESRGRIASLSTLAAGLGIVAASVLSIIILGLGGIMASIVKRLMKDISIRLCLGVAREFIYMEVLLATSIPAIVGGVFGAAASGLFMEYSNLDIFTASIPIWTSAASIGLAVFVGMLASLVPLRQVGKVQPLQVLRES